MTIYDRFEIVIVPFPFSDIPRYKGRPAVVISDREYNKQYEQTMVCMITSGVTIQWKDDIEISQMKPTGLPVTSYMRPKIGTIDNNLIAKSIGNLSADDADKLKKKLKKLLGF
jgi:mRNA interferase MazF